VTGKFLEYKNSHDYKYALFEDVKNVDDKQTLYKGIKVDDYGKLKFAVAPHEFAADRFEPTYKIYQPIENLREEVARRMINSQYSLSEGNPSTYEDTPVKNSVGDDLAKEISKYLGLGGRRHRKSRKTRKSRKSRKTKSRRRR
jgi:hypothetical protein